MARTRYTITTTGNQTVVHREGPNNLPRLDYVPFRQDVGDARAALPEKPKKAARRNRKKKDR